jgi:signal transduction histidine kinase
MVTPDLRLAGAALTLVPVLVWSAIARDIWQYVRERKPQGGFARVLVPVTALEALHFIAFMLMLILPSSWRQLGSPAFDALLLVIDLTVILVVAFSRHLVLLWPMRSERPSDRWLAVNYGLCAIAATLIVLLDLGIVRWPGSFQTIALTFNGYLLVMGALIVADLRRLGGPGGWRAGGVGDTRTADAVAIGSAFVVVAVTTAVPMSQGTTFVNLMLGTDAPTFTFWMAAFHALGGLLFAMPFIARSMGDVLPSALTGLVMVAIAGCLLAGAHELAARVDPEVKRFVMLCLLLSVALGLAPVRARAHARFARFLFRQERARWLQVHRALRSLSPEQGAAACCSRTGTELVRSLGLRGAAILLHDGSVIAHGDIDVESIRRVWPRQDGVIPDRTFSGMAFRDLPRPVADALMAADVLMVVPIASPRRRWGHAFLRTDLRGASFNDDEDAAIDGVADQLALLLDGCELLSRAVTVERQLAHAEKLAAIGELAARVAHEIRNPITAARSLAQQLSREPTAAFKEELGIILEELERVERQVATLLRFARREELSCAPVDVGALVRATVEHCRPRLDAAGTSVELDAPPGIVARGDAEKLRQVLINLIENAADALAAFAGPRALRLAVERTAERVAVAVRDSGPGVAADVLPRLVEPFFSLKPSGTGLGLAIARRTIEAHGGRLLMASTPGAGFTVTMELPA